MTDIVVRLYVWAIILVSAIEHVYNCGEGHFFNMAYYGLCSPCPIGQHQPEPWNIKDRKYKCEHCPTNSYNDLEGQADCKLCPTGTTTFHRTGAISVDACEGCPANTYFYLENYVIQCLPCGNTKPGLGYHALPRYSDSGSTSASQCYAQCPSGNYFEPTYGNCLHCEPGSYSDTGLQADGACKPCAAGFYQEDKASTGCKKCWHGTYSPPGSDHCPLCKPGTHNAKWGAERCEPCDPGFYNTRHGMTFCIACLKGEYAPAGSTSCRLCEQGTYADFYHQASCDSCPFGTTTVNNGSTIITDCYPKDYVFYMKYSTNMEKYLGCFRDAQDRDLSGSGLLYEPNDMTLRRCFGYCYRRNYTYSGLQAGVECWCGHSYGKYGMIDESECSAECAGNQTATCGGVWANAVYGLFEGCENGGPVKPLNKPAGNWINVFKDLNFGCSGDVQSWKFYAQGPGIFHPSAWRIEGRSEVRLIGANTITVTDAGVHEVEILEAERIRVLSSDVIGVYYDSPFVAGVVNYENEYDTRTPGTSDVKFSYFFDKGRWDTQVGNLMNLGTVYPNHKRTIAMRATVVDIDECRSAPCKNGGTCEDLGYSYTCACDDDYTGTNCDSIYIGCFFAISTGDFELQRNTIPVDCFAFCRKHGYSYSGLGTLNHCWCHHSYDGRPMIGERYCSSLCGGHNDFKCGISQFTSALYQLD